MVLRFVRELGSFQPGRLYLLSIFLLIEIYNGYGSNRKALCGSAGNNVGVLL